MSKKLLYEDVKQQFKEMGYDLISKEYIDNRHKLIFKDSQGYVYYSLLSILKRGNSYKFHKSNPYSIQNIKLWCEINNKSFELVGDIFISSDKNKLKWHCKKCDEIFEATWANIEKDRGCGFCAGKQAGVSNGFAILNPEILKEWNYNRNININPYDFTYGSNKKVWWKCTECSHEWCTNINRRTIKHCGCPKCNQSKGEKQIGVYLENNHIVYTNQFSFDDLYGDFAELRFDFAIFNKGKKLKCLIEYDGEFHFKKQYKNDGFEKIQRYDKIKNNYCKNNNIKLIRIPYWKFDNIEQILGTLI